MTTASLAATVEQQHEDSDSSDEEWVFSSVPSTRKQQAPQKQQQAQPPLAAVRPQQKQYQQLKKPLQKLTISPASIRTIRANLPRNNFIPSTSTSSQQQQSPLPLQIIKSVNAAMPPPPSLVKARQQQQQTTQQSNHYKPQQPIRQAQPPAPPSLDFISDAELEQLCTEMNAQLLVTRLVHVYKSCEVFIKIKEIETRGNTVESMSIESRMKDYLSYAHDPCDFILNALKSLSIYFAENNKQKDLSPKFRRLLAHSFCTALARFLDTPIEKRVPVNTQQQQQQPEEEKEMDLISFEEEEEPQQEEEKVLISFDDHVEEQQQPKQENKDSGFIGFIEVVQDDSDETEEDSDEEEEKVITLADMLGVPEEIIDRYTLKKDHQLKLISMIDTIPAPIIVYYAMDIFQLVGVCSFGCTYEDDGVKLCKALMKHGHYEETIACIKRLNLYTRFPIIPLADQFFTAGCGSALLSLIQGQPTLQKELLSFINKQLRFNYAGHLDIVPREYLQDLIDGTDKTQQLSRLKERKFQKDLVNCGAKILKECHLEEKDHYFITLSQQYASLRFILAQRAIQQIEDGGDLSIEASSNFNGLIDLVCENDPVLARLAIKELIDTGDTIAPPYFASLYKQQEFYCRYNALPLNHRLLGIVKGEQMSRHRSFLNTSSGQKKSSNGLQYYTLPPKAKWMMVDSHKSLIYMKDILSTCNVCGIDTEWVPAFAKSGTVKTALMQIACDIDDMIFLLDLKTMFLPQHLQLFKITTNILQLLFEDDQIIKIAFDFSGDFDLLHSSIPGSTEWQVSQLLDLKSLKTMPASLADQGQVIQGGLAGVTQHFLGVTLNKRQQLSNWEKRPLTEEQALYGACDAYCLLEIYYTLVRLNHPFIQKYKLAAVQ